MTMPPSTPLLAFLSGPEILAILIVVLLLFGAKRLPELARGLGKSMREFRRAASEAEDSFKEAIEEKPDRKTPSAGEKAREEKP